MLTQRALIGNLSNSLVNEAELELDLSELEKTYNKIMETGMTENDVIELSPKQIIKDLDERLAVTRNENIRKSRTTKLLSDCNWTRTHNHLVCKRTLNHLAKLTK